MENATEPNATSHRTPAKKNHAAARELAGVKLPHGHPDRKRWELGMDALNMAMCKNHVITSSDLGSTTPGVLISPSPVTKIDIGLQ